MPTYVDTNGTYLGVFADGAIPPQGAIDVPDAPSGLHRWVDHRWVAPEPTPGDVNLERDRRMWSTFIFHGRAYACDPASLARITGAATLAGFSKGAAGNLHWHGGAEIFAWIADDNGLTYMDAPTMFAFGQAAAANESAHIFAARSVKDMSPIPFDFRDDKYWPH